MNAPLEKIIGLEAKLAASIEGRPAALGTIAKRVASAEEVLAKFQLSPMAGDVDKSLAAVSTVEAGKSLTASLGDEKPWTAFLRHHWLSENIAALVDSLEKQLESRAAGRSAYRQSKAEEIGKLSKEIILADGNGAADTALEILNAQLAEIEEDLASRENGLRYAQEVLRDLKRQPAPSWEFWSRARQAVSAVDFTEAASA